MLNRDAHAMVMRAVTIERGRQETQWPGRTCADDGFSDAFRLSILMEEVGEVATEVCEAERDAENRDEAMFEEAVQVAAVAVAWCEHLVSRRTRHA